MDIISTAEDFVAVVRLLALADYDQECLQTSGTLNLSYNDNRIAIKKRTDGHQGVAVGVFDSSGDVLQMEKGSSILDGLEKMSVSYVGSLYQHIKFHWFDFDVKQLCYEFKDTLTELDSLEFVRTGRVSATKNVVSLSVCDDDPVMIKIVLKRYDDAMNNQGSDFFFMAARDLEDLPEDLDNAQMKIFFYNLFKFCDGQNESVTVNGTFFAGFKEGVGMVPRVQTSMFNGYVNWF